MEMTEDDMLEIAAMLLIATLPVVILYVITKVSKLIKYRKR